MAVGGKKPGSPKTGGRKPGTPNHRSAETRRLIERTLGASPLAKMAKLARELLEGKHKLSRPVVVDKTLEMVEDRGFQLRLAADLLGNIAQYHSPKRKAIEHSGAVQVAPGVKVYLPNNGRG